jgi:hypothetical protein
MIRPSRTFALPTAAVVALLLLAASGCITNKKWNPAATQPVTIGNPDEATPKYWLEKPATDEVAAADFTTLFDAAEQVTRDYWFRIDRRDYRAGLLLSQPMVSKQWFEPWRKDAGTVHDVEENSLGPIRRTVYFQFRQNPDGTFSATPKVLVERYSKVGVAYQTSYAMRREATSYWYALRRDQVMEQHMADTLRRKLKQEVRPRQTAGDWSDPSSGRRAPEAQ